MNANSMPIHSFVCYFFSDQLVSCFAFCFKRKRQFFCSINQEQVLINYNIIQFNRTLVLYLVPRLCMVHGLLDIRLFNQEKAFIFYFSFQPTSLSFLFSRRKKACIATNSINILEKCQITSINFVISRREKGTFQMYITEMF